MPTGLLVAAPSTNPNQRLLGAALAGLLCLVPAACSVKDDTSPGTGAAGSAEPAAAGATSSKGGEVSAAAGDSGQGGVITSGGAPGSLGGAADSAGTGGSGLPTAGTSDSAGSANVAGAGGAPPDPPHITSSEAVGVLTEEDFKALCDARGGTVEVMPHCGGFATAKGFSYDSGTQLLSEHTCAGANTCGGWNCVIAD